MPSILRPAVVRALLRFLALSLAPFLGLASAAGARASADGTMGPLAISRIERVARLFSSLDARELGALGGAHESYLDRFRMEIANDAAAAAARTVDLQPSDEGFAETLAVLDRIAERVAMLDESFIADAAARLGEARRAAVDEIAAVRERQRLTRGFRTDAVRPLGNGGDFVDLVDLVAREADAGSARLTEEARGSLAAFASAASPRLSAEARAFDLARRQALVRWTGAMRALEESSEAQAMRESIRVATEAGRELRRVLREHHAANRAALAGLPAAVGEELRVRIRERAALRALGEASFRALGNDRAASLAAIIVRAGAGSDPALAAAELAWRSERTRILEDFTAAIDAGDLPSWAASDPGAAQESAQEFGRASKALVTADAGFADLIARALGERATEFLERQDGSDPMLADLGIDAGPARWIPRPAAALDAAALAPDSEDGHARAAGDAISRAELEAVFARTGTAFDAAVLDGVYAAWRTNRWDAEVVPLDAAFRAAIEDATGMADVATAGAATAVREAGERRLAAIERAERALESDLREALALEPGSPCTTLFALLALGRVECADSAGPGPGIGPGIGIGFGSGGMSVAPDPLRVLDRARATPDEIRALLSDDPAAWRALAAEAAPARVRLLANLERSLRLAPDFTPDTPGNLDRIRARSEDLAREHAAIVDRLRESLAVRLDEAARRTVSVPERRAAFSRALQRESFPGYFAAAPDAERQLDGALALADIDDDLRASLEALRAEYLAVFEDRTGRIIALSREDALATAAPREARAARAAEIARLGAERDERTAKAIAEIRRLLGDARARRVPGVLGPGGGDENGAPRSAWEIVAGDE